ncbi:MAG: hypothetical protein ACREIC_10320 [Limisphaerales bacterium]
MAPPKMPDTAELNWRYILVGFVDLASGEIIEDGEFAISMSA